MRLTHVIDGYTAAVEWLALAQRSESDEPRLWEEIASGDVLAPTDDWREEVTEFAESAFEILCTVADAGIWADGHQIGHDFYLTRNGHGAGFWDRYASGSTLGKIGNELSELAKTYGASEHTWTDGEWWVTA